jgi:hypothetical protein
MEREEQRKTVKSHFTDELKLVAHPVGPPDILMDAACLLAAA